MYYQELQNLRRSKLDQRKDVLSGTATAINCLRVSYCDNQDEDDVDDDPQRSIFTKMYAVSVSVSYLLLMRIGHVNQNHRPGLVKRFRNIPKFVDQKNGPIRACCGWDGPCSESCFSESIP